jgi:hypothetical protein
MREPESNETASWVELIRRAAGPEVSTGEAGFASVAFVVTGIIQGAAHAPLSAGEAPLERTRAFADALVEQARRGGHLLRVVWCAPTRGPHVGTAVRGLCVSLETLALPRSIDPLHITQTIDAARGAAETAVLAIAELMGQLAELSRAQREHLRGLPGGDALEDCVRRAEAVEAGASAVLHHLQFQDRTSQMLLQATEQATEVIRLAGLQERALTEAALHQVGRLGRELAPDGAPSEGGTFELF